MKKVVFIASAFIIALTTTTGFIFSRGTWSRQMRFNAKDLGEHGLIIIKPSDPNFHAIFTELSKGMSDDDKERLEPFSVVIKNTGKETVVAYALIWECLSANGKTQIYQKISAESEALTDSEEYFSALSRTKLDRTIKPNGFQLFSLLPLPGEGGGGDISTSNQLEQNQQLSKYTAITVSIDGVFFSNGKFVGPDTTGFFDKMKAQVEAKQDLRKAIRENLKAGKNRDEIFKDVQDKANAPSKIMNPTQSSSYLDQYNFFTRFFANQFLMMRRAYGNDKALEKALGKDKPEIVLQRIK